MPEPIVIATWPFGKTAADTAWKLLAAGGKALDAALAGAQAVEDDPRVRSVGYGAIGNAVGTVSRDACVMDGQTLDCGAVAGVENIRHTAALARKVMEKTPHVLMVGEGALWFALQNGFPLQTHHTPSSVGDWYNKHPNSKSMATPEVMGPTPPPFEFPSEKNPKGSPPPTPPAPVGAPEDFNVPMDIHEQNHDTVTVLCRDAKGHLGGVCTTSGLAYKLPGRVGDSPLIGAGLYVDDLAGAAGATGVGEEIIRIHASSFIVELMRSGKSAQEAVEAAVKRFNDTAARRGKHPLGAAFIALDPQGRPGAACSVGTNFIYAVGTAGKVELRRAIEVPPSM